MTVTLHWMDYSAAHRVLWLLLELGTPHEVKIHQRDKKTYLAPKELQEVHPLGKVPVIEDDGETLAESGYIVEHLIAKYGPGTELEAKSTEEEKKVKLALYHANSLIPAQTLILVTSGLRTRAPFLVRPITNIIANRIDDAFAKQDIVKQLNYLEGLLKSNGTGFFVGNHLSGADIMYSFPVGNMFFHMPDGMYFNQKDYPLLKEWLKMIHSRPALKKSYEDVPEPDLSVQAKL